MKISKSKISFCLKITVALLIVSIIIWKYDYLTNLDIRGLIEKSPSFLATILTLEAVYAIKGLTMVIPASLVYIAVGMALSIKSALIINSFGILIEITITYLLGLFLGGDAVISKIKSIKKGEKILSIYDKYKKPGIFLIRFFGLPIDFCSLFFGAMKVPFPEYLIFSFIGIMPRVIIFTILGDKVYNLIPMKYIIPAVLVIIGIAIVIYVFKTILNKSKKEENN